MLVQFSLKNVLSFQGEAVLDMTAISAYKEHPTHLIEIGTKGKFLKVAAIYGANASGKSNLHVAMSYFQRIVVESMNNTGESGKIAIEKYYAPFSFEEIHEDSEFEIVVILGGYEYRYGFAYNAQCIVEEWLYRKNIKTNRTVSIFERSKDKIQFGPSVRKECDLYKGQIPATGLVLSFFSRLKMKTNVFDSVYDGIMETLVVPIDFCESPGFLQEFLPQVLDEYALKKKLLYFLDAIDTGIRDVVYEKDEQGIRFQTIHKGKNGKLYPLNLYVESEGTIKSVMLFIYAQMALNLNRALFVDELNIKLHPLLLKFIVDLFYEEASSAQLIYTTHDTTLMDKKFFRRDQIWFVQKDAYGYSELVALAEYKVRSDASFEKDYLAGVYGGIPLLKEFTMKEGD